MGGSDGGGGTTTVVTQPSPAGSGAGPAIVPEGKAGYEQAQTFYKGILQNPPIFQGQRLAPVAPAQGAAIDQSLDFYGSPQPFQLLSENQIGSTARGDYLGGPASQAAIASLADPIFARFRDETMPMIRDRSQFSGQGLTSTRREVANDSAIDNLGRQLATSVIAPIFEGERTRQIQAASLAPVAMATEASRLSGLRGAGEYERGLQQQQLDVNRAIFEEPLFRQSEAASALGGMAGFGPGGTISRSTSTQTSSAGDQALGWAQTALLATAVGKSLFR